MNSKICTPYYVKAFIIASYALLIKGSVSYYDLLQKPRRQKLRRSCHGQAPSIHVGVLQEAGVPQGDCRARGVRVQKVCMPCTPPPCPLFASVWFQLERGACVRFASGFPLHRVSRRDMSAAWVGCKTAGHGSLSRSTTVVI